MVRALQKRGGKMKKKFGLFALVLGLMLCASLFLFAACAGEEEDDSTDTPVAISVTVNGEGQTSGATINGDTEDVYTISASVSSGSNVTIAYVVGDGAVESFTGNSFAPDAAGTYVFTFKAEEAADFTLTFEITAAQTPAVPVITASADKTAITAGEQVVLNWSATESAQVTVTYKKDGESASVLQPESGVAFTISEAGVYVFTFAAEGAQPVEVTITVTAKHTHTYGAWTVTAPTADTAGQAVQTCTGCESSEEGHTQTVTLPALNSDEAKTAYTSAVTTIATCTTKEVTTYVFQENNAITFDITGAVSYEQKAHKNLTYVAAVEPTCTAAGKIAHAYCSDCGKYYTVTGDADDFTIGNEITDGAAGLTGDPATNHSYMWSIKEGDEPFVEKAGTATGTCSCGSTTTRELPAMTNDNANQDVTTPTVGKYSFNFTQQGSCTQETIAEITYKFEDGVTVTFTLKQPPFEHSYSKVEVKYDAATMSTTWSAKAYCDLGCGTSVEVGNIPAVDISDESVWVWDEEGDHKLPTCGEGGYATYYYSGLELSDGTPIKVFVTNVPLPATGEHSYGKPVYSGSTVTVTCEVCETASVSATVTIGGGESATGTTEFGSDAFSFADGTFTVTLPQNAFEKDGFTFSGWSNGTTTAQPNGTFTVEANGTLTITAQWTEDEQPETPVVSLTVKIGDTPISTGNGGNTYACIDTRISYEAAVTGGGAVSASYKVDSGEDVSLEESGNFTFTKVGTYVFTITAAGAADYVYTVEIVAHDFTDQAYISAGEDGHYQVCKNCNVAHSATVAHTYGGTVLFAEGVASVSCTECAEKQSVTVTMNGNEGTGEMTLTAENFSYEEGSFVLILPQNDYTAPANCWFYAWSIGAKEYFAGEEAKIAVGNEVTITAEWEQLSVGETGTDISLGRWAQPLTYPLNLTNGKSFMLTAQLGGTFASGEFYEGIYVVVHDTEADPFVFRPDNWWFYSNYNPDNSYANKTITREVTIQFNGNAGLGSAADFQKVKAENRTQIVVSKENGVITIKYNFINTENTPVVQSTYTINNLAENTLLEFCYDGANITANDVSISGDVMISNNQAPTSDVPVMIGSDNAGADVDAWVSVIKKGTKVVISGTQTSSATENWFTAGVGLFSDLTARAYFRGDNYVDNTTSEDANVTHDLAYEGWHITKQMSHENDWNAFKSMIADCEQTITIDWTNEEQIVITFEYLDEAETVISQNYIVTASAENVLDDQYYFSLGYNTCTMTVTDVVRTHA